ncbi:GAF domain-containing protein [Mucilaginibacter sp. UR6-11]|uniref:GAF domain-containing protein n=1 Tax=Mucilaginibacter sp. UR6-11 TaxID=1435644 RepID=UPI001E61BD32|nr:GAF domain-containing protein [Mucilaginibacter sp. UR6-11]MCC8424678.1 GAF domain-containing protein [Mucilaginibacter sp. UR6-11]
MEQAEHKRLEIVRRFKALNLSKSQELNDLVLLASEICNTPIAMITLMDDDIQWIECAIGADIDHNSRENSFCKYLVEAEDVLVVPDALKDSRFTENPIVTGPAHIRSYAGAPLITSDGYHVGSLCVFDQKPHSFSARETRLLAILSKQVVNLMDLELSLQTVKLQKEIIIASEQKLRAYFNSSSSSHMLLGKDLEILDFNQACQNFVAKLNLKHVVLGANVLDYVRPSFKTKFVDFFKKALGGKSTYYEILMEYETGPAWWKIGFEPVKDEHGKIISVSYQATDITESKQQIAEIVSKNESLLNIAYIQSHGYRKPVASIMGLMNIIKGEDYKPQKECLLMMEEAVNELDEKIKEVVNCTDINSCKNSA